MNDDVRKYIYGTVVVFVVGVLIWVGFIFVSACGLTLTCKRGEYAVERTPIPTLIPATLPAMQAGSGEVVKSDRCRAAAVDLIEAWVEAGSPEKNPFQFKDINGQNCESTFKEVRSLFVEANIWYPGSIACISCHSVDLTVSPAQLDLSSFEGIIAGSRRPDDKSKGTNILGSGNWKSSLLYEFLSAKMADIPGHTVAVSGLVIFAGKPQLAPDLTATPTTPDISTTPAP